MKRALIAAIKARKAKRPTGDGRRRGAALWGGSKDLRDAEGVLLKGAREADAERDVPMSRGEWKHGCA